MILNNSYLSHLVKKVFKIIQKMIALFYLVLSIVFNFLTSGINDNNPSKISFNHSIKKCKNKNYSVKELKSHYMITEEELSIHLKGIY